MDSLIADLTVFRQKDDQFLKFKVNIWPILTLLQKITNHCKTFCKEKNKQ
jgi:hypothetical protein